MHAVVIINPVSGGRAGRAAEQRSALAERAALRAGVRVTVHVTTHRGHATEIARTAHGTASDLVVAWGGDGTVNEVATGLAFTPTPMGIVAAGSGNGLARELGLPSDAARALDVAFTGRQRAIDLGEVNGRLFVNVAGIGFDACVARAFNAERRGGWGLVRYFSLAMREVRNYTPQRYRIAHDGGVAEVAAYVVAVANSGQYGNGARIAPHARLDDGVLEVAVVDAAPAWRLILESPRLFTGSIARSRHVRMLSLRQGVIESAAPMAIHVDGEPMEPATRAEVRVHREALRVVVPG